MIGAPRDPGFRTLHAMSESTWLLQVLMRWAVRPVYYLSCSSAIEPAWH